MGISVDTIDRRCKKQLKLGRARMKSSLRRWMLKLAKEGNAAMQIHLSVNQLGMTNSKYQGSKPQQDKSYGTTITPDQEAAAMDATVPAAPPVSLPEEAIPHEPQPTPQGTHEQEAQQNEQQEDANGIPVLN